MKKIAILYSVSLLGLIILSCKKRESTRSFSEVINSPITPVTESLRQIKQPNYEISFDAVNKIIDNFKNGAAVAKTQTIGLIGLDSALWVLEAVTNHDYDNDFSENYQIGEKTINFSIPVFQDDQVSDEDVVELYTLIQDRMDSLVTDSTRVICVDFDAYLLNQGTNSAIISAKVFYLFARKPLNTCDPFTAAGAPLSTWWVAYPNSAWLPNWGCSPVVVGVFSVPFFETGLRMECSFAQECIQGYGSYYYNISPVILDPSNYAPGSSPFTFALTRTGFLSQSSLCNSGTGTNFLHTDLKSTHLGLLRSERDANVPSGKIRVPGAAALTAHIETNNVPEYSIYWKMVYFVGDRGCRTDPQN